MSFDYLNTNIYKSTKHAYTQNFPMIVFTALFLLALEIVQPIFDLSTSVTLVPEILLEITVAYGFHTTILLGVPSVGWRDQFKARKVDDRYKPFMWRSIAFVGMMVGIMIPLAVISYSIAPVFGGDRMEKFAGLFIISLVVIGLPIYGLLFAVYGTMLPAAVSGVDRSFSAAFRRAKGLFWFTYGRLFMGPALFSLGLLALTIGLVRTDLPVVVYTGDGELSVVGIGVAFFTYAAGLFSVGLTATVLCKTYLRSVEKAEQST